MVLGSKGMRIINCINMVKKITSEFIKNNVMFSKGIICMICKQLTQLKFKNTF